MCERGQPDMRAIRWSAERQRVIGVYWSAFGSRRSRFKILPAAGERQGGIAEVDAARTFVAGDLLAGNA